MNTKPPSPNLPLETDRFWGLEKKHWPSLVTLSRMALCVPFVAAYLLFSGATQAITCAALFILAALTDWLDGYLARKWNAQSNFGKFIDPVADKVLVLCVLILVSVDRMLHPLLPILVLSRDIIIGGVRSAAAADQKIIDAKPTGKWKTAVQMIAIPVLLLDSLWLKLGFSVYANGLLWISAVLSLVSAWEYIQIYRQS